jgi:hypothetical protein
MSDFLDYLMSFDAPPANPDAKALPVLVVGEPAKNSAEFDLHVREIEEAMQVPVIFEEVDDEDRPTFENAAAFTELAETLGRLPTLAEVEAWRSEKLNEIEAKWGPQIDATRGTP